MPSLRHPGVPETLEVLFLHRVSSRVPEARILVTDIPEPLQLRLYHHRLSSMLAGMSSLAEIGAMGGILGSLFSLFSVLRVQRILRVQRNPGLCSCCLCPAHLPHHFLPVIPERVCYSG